MNETRKPAELPSFSTQEELDALLLEGLKSGEPMAVTPQFWRDLETDLASRKGARQKVS